MSSGAGRTKLPNNQNNRTNIYRNQKKFNGDGHRQPEPSTNYVPAIKSNQQNLNSNHGPKTTKRSQI